jgi:hypothetical protein
LPRMSRRTQRRAIALSSSKFARSLSIMCGNEQSTDRFRGRAAAGLAEDVAMRNGHLEADCEIWEAVHHIAPGRDKLCTDAPAEM